MADEPEHPGTGLNGWIIVVIVLILAAAAVAITALVTRGSGTTDGAHGVAQQSSTSTTAAPTTTSTSAAPTSSLRTYSTGDSNAGWPTYDLSTDNCSSLVATYEYSWMGVTSAPTPITVPPGGLVQLAGIQATDNTITVTAAPATISLAAGLPYPQSDQAGILVAGHDTLVSYKCG